MIRNQTSLALWVVGLLLLLAGCFPSYEVKDGAPTQQVDVSKIPDAVPRLEPITRAGNKNPYTILGKTYHLLPTSEGYREVGIASWYGTKFHGQKTANGETYSMFAMTAAHTRLPIPSYVRVNNLENGRSVIVRINDRGPFHKGRIIDLSYAAAIKLGYSDKGTARVEVVAIDPRDYQRNSVEAPNIQNQASSVSSTSTSPPVRSSAYLQAGAFGAEASAQNLASRVRLYTEHPVKVTRSTTSPLLYKVLVGPFVDTHLLNRMRERLTKENLSPFIVYN